MRPKPAPPKRSTHEIVAELTDELVDVDSTFATTYRPSHHEQGWLLSSLAPFYDKGLIIDVLSLVKGGKEASVYCCQAHPATGLDVVAAKVYRPRMFRNLRNDKMYRQGRGVLTEDGKPAGHEAGHIERAIRNRSNFGLRAEHTAWLMYEFTALEQLWAAGAAVPRPLGSGENAVLMSYHGDEQQPAPTLNTVSLEPEEAEGLFGEVLRNVELMLRHGLIHGDLSAYNILYCAPKGGADGPGEIVLIDFPQVVSLRFNEKAQLILERDIQRVCEYFIGQGVPCRPRAIARELWARYGGDRRPDDMIADWSRFLGA
jgi:RIO kinase 1